MSFSHADRTVDLEKIDSPADFKAAFKGPLTGISQEAQDYAASPATLTTPTPSDSPSQPTAEANHLPRPIPPSPARSPIAAPLACRVIPPTCSLQAPPPISITAPSNPAAIAGVTLAEKRPLVLEGVSQPAKRIKTSNRDRPTKPLPRRTPSGGGKLSTDAEVSSNATPSSVPALTSATTRDTVALASTPSSTVKFKTRPPQRIAMSTGGAPPTGLLPISPPTGSPPWMLQSLSMFQRETLGSEWLKLVSAWVKFESSKAFADSPAFATTSRPKPISDWIQRARKSNYHPQIPDMKKYLDAFRRWWFTLQPIWRQEGDGTVGPADIERDWDSLRRSGKNGWLSILAALFFLGEAVKYNSQKDTQVFKVERKDWVQLVAECRATLYCVVSTA